MPGYGNISALYLGTLKMVYVVEMEFALLGRPVLPAFKMNDYLSLLLHIRGPTLHRNSLLPLLRWLRIGLTSTLTSKLTSTTSLQKPTVREQPML